MSTTARVLVALANLVTGVAAVRGLATGFEPIAAPIVALVLALVSTCLLVLRWVLYGTTFAPPVSDFLHPRETVHHRAYGDQ